MLKVFFIFLLFFYKSAFSIDIDETIKSTIENNPKVKIGLFVVYSIILIAM